jgi:hypothetical protein
MSPIQQTKNKKTKQNNKKRKRKPVDAYGRGCYISQYSSIMFKLVYSTRVFNLL